MVKQVPGETPVIGLYHEHGFQIRQVAKQQRKRGISYSLLDSLFWAVFQLDRKRDVWNSFLGELDIFFYSLTGIILGDT